MTQQVEGHGGPVGGSARGVVREGAGAARDVAGEARAVGSALREEAAGLGDSLRQGLSRQVERQKDGVAERIAALALRAERGAEELRGEEAWLAGLLGRGARELHMVAEEIRGHDVADLVGSVEVLARRQPALFTGAAVALGFALARVVRGDPRAARGDRGSGETGSADEPGGHGRSEGMVAGSGV